MRRALADARVPDTGRLWFGDWTFESGYRTGREVAGGDAPPTGLVVLNELMAAGCLQALQDGGCKVPRDLSVVTVEDSRWVEYVRPALTAVHVPMDGVARRATEILLASIESAGSVSRESLETELVVRASSSRVRGSSGRPDRHG